MMIRTSSAVLFIGGVMLWIFCKAIPFLAVIGMDFVAVFMMGGGIFILLFIFPISGASKQYDTLPPGARLVNFIRRDATIQPLVCRRVFAGESFLEEPSLGLIEDIGKDTVFLWGRKKVRFGLENINYTPDPRHFNLTRELYHLGFDDSDDLYNVLNIPNMSPESDKAMKTYYLERMGNIYWNMVHSPPRGGKRLVRDFKLKPKKNVVFGRKRHTTPVISKPMEQGKNKSVEKKDKYDEIDKVIYRHG